MTIGQIIVQLRKKCGLTQEMLAEKLNVSRQAISKWENSASQPDLDNIRALSEFFGVPADTFLNTKNSSAGLEISEKNEQAKSNNSKSEYVQHGFSDVSAIDKNSNTLTNSFVLTLAACTIPLLICFLCLAFTFALKHFSFIMLYSWLIPLFATASVTAGGVVLIFMQKTIKRKLPCVLCLIPCILASVLMWIYFCIDMSSFSNTVSRSPNSGFSVLIRRDKSGSATCYTEHFPLIFKKRDDIPYKMEEQLKIDWITDDICAVTYMSLEDNAAHQYIATFSDRSNGSYYYVLNALYGNWSGAESGTGEWKITANDGKSAGITLEIAGHSKEFYSYEDCVQFGTTAIALCRGGIPHWTIALNTDCTIEETSNLIAPNGTITLVQVSKRKLCFGHSAGAA